MREFRIPIAFCIATLAATTPLSAKTLVFCSEGSPENFYPAINTTGTSLELDHAAVNLAVGVERRAGGVDGRIEVFRAALRAEHQCLCRERRRGRECGDAESDRDPEFTHGALPRDMRRIPKPVSNHTVPPGSCQRPPSGAAAPARRPVLTCLVTKGQTPTYARSIVSKLGGPSANQSGVCS